MARIPLLSTLIVCMSSIVAATTTTTTTVDLLYSSRLSHITPIIPRTSTVSNHSSVGHTISTVSIPIISSSSIRLSQSSNHTHPTITASRSTFSPVQSHPTIPIISIAPSSATAGNCTSKGWKTTTTIYVQPSNCGNTSHSHGVSSTLPLSSYTMKPTTTTPTVPGTGITSRASSAQSTGYGSPSSFSFPDHSHNTTYHSPTLPATSVSGTSALTTISTSSKASSSAQPSEPLFTGGAERVMGVGVGGVVVGVFAMVL
ncbi:hypothetical protein P280DRAFT_241686 [Massarina eburnea CBS 473.64]|uniref:GPI anchored protein n=1 Tax=Massarina eburnea CBS 473.64 TaxID=1395130 RepID=A0A6A6S5I1_9PLEO|nr:hypothetical protein P280DRAFT_241686 [Massarina eburnea CBS 473.64]